MRILVISLSLLMFLSLSCKKDEPSVKTEVDFSVTNSWECVIDGVQYSGSIDTSILDRLPQLYNTYDTMLYCTGTSFDKKANIHFRLYINRAGSRSNIVLTTLSEFNFDTSTSTHFKAGSGLGEMTFYVDSLNGTKFKGRFDGTAFASSGGGNKVVSNGKFSFDIGRGNNEPKFLSCRSDGTPIRGYVSSANLISNTLIIDGLGFHADSTFQLMIRTGSKLKTGVFESRNGDVGFQAFRPSVVTNFVSDAIGDLTVTIQSVAGNIVEGTFSGVAQGTSTGSEANISEGKFRCRVRNYVPQQDSTNKWGFSESNGLQYPYFTWGGNIVNAQHSQDAGWNYITINGESDNGSSTFKLKLRSASPLSPGLYESGSNWPNNLDSVYFFCGPLGQTFDVSSRSGMACQVDSIDQQRIVGHFYGMNGGWALRRGYFTANF